jgi:hypothetical protein
MSDDMHDVSRVLRCIVECKVECCSDAVRAECARYCDHMRYALSVVLYSLHSFIAGEAS